MPILIALDDAADDDAELEVLDDDAAADDELLLLPPQAAIHSPQMAHTAATVSNRGARRTLLLSKTVTSSVTFLILHGVRSCRAHAFRIHVLDGCSN